MRMAAGILAGLIGMCGVLSAGVQATEETAGEQWAVYQGLEPGAFMKQWLVCMPFPLFDESEKPGDAAAQREAFDRDLLTDHGGETQIQPTAQMIHERNGKKHHWLKIESPDERRGLSSGTSATRNTRPPTRGPGSICPPRRRPCSASAATTP